METGTLALAASIAAMNRAELTELVASRRISNPESIEDPLGLSIELLRADSVARALKMSHRETLEMLIALAAGGEASPHEKSSLQEIARLGLIGLDDDTGSFVSLPEIERQLKGVVLPQGAEVAARPENADTLNWYGQAITSVRRAAELVRRLGIRPVRLGRKGTLTIVSLRELAQEKHIDIGAVEHLLEAMRVTGLLSQARGHGGAQLLVPTASARDWLSLDYPDRWLMLAQAALDDVDDRLRRDLKAARGSLRHVVAQAHIHYPLLPDAELEKLQQQLSFCDELGITVTGQTTDIACALLRGETETAREMTHRDFPSPVEGVYLQPDLSLIVPGPLAPTDEAALHSIAETEQLGVAATMRLSQTSLVRAVRGGLSPSAIRGLLTRLSLTGIPQPLDFLLTELERRDHEVADTTVVYEDQTPQGSPAPPNLATHDAVALAEMIERVIIAAQSSDGSLSRRLELAIRHRSPVQVTAVSGADKRVFTLLPVSLRDGRLRATDQQAGVERTLPVSAITAVEAA